MPVETLEKSWECFSRTICWASNASRTLFTHLVKYDVSKYASEHFWQRASDARERLVRLHQTRPMPLCICNALWVRVWCLGERLVVRIRWPHMKIHPLCVRVQCAPDAFGSHLTVSVALYMTVGDQHMSFKKVTHGCHLSIRHSVPVFDGSLAARPVSLTFVQWKS